MATAFERYWVGWWCAAALAAAAAVHGQQAPEQSLTLVRDETPTCTIILAEQPTRAAQFAAYELQWHLEQITGARVPIASEDAQVAGTRVLVGDGAATRALGIDAGALSLQEYVVRFLPDAVVLLGRDKDDRGTVRYAPEPDGEMLATWPGIWDEQGTMHAVYDFLQRTCGVRWFGPTEYGMDCPKTATLTVSGRDVRRAPFFRYRFAAYPPSEGYDAYTGLWPGGSDGFTRWEAEAFPGIHQRFPDQGAYNLAKRGRMQLFRLRMREGGEKCVGNHSLYGYYKRFWEKSTDAPDAFVGRKEDWFAQGYGGTPPQLCYTSPGLIKQVAQDAIDYFDGKGINPWSLGPVSSRNDVWGEDFFCVEPMDNDAFCKCARCRELLGKEDQDSPFFSNGRHSDYFFNFVNEVAREVRKTHPDKWIVTLAYMSHATHPRRVKLEPNVAVQFCFACNRLNFDRPSYEHEVELLKEWREKEPDRPLYLWLYYTFPVEIANNGKFHCFPGFFAHAVGEQFALFHKLGLRGMFHCGYGQDVEAYVTYRLMDDPTLSVDDLLEEYFDRLYGRASEPMEQLYLAIEQTYSDPANYPEAIAEGRIEGHHHQTEEVAWGYLGTEARMARFQALLDQAKALAASEAEKQRVKLFELGTWEYMLAGRKLYMEHTRAMYGGGGAPVRVPYIAPPEIDGDATRLDTSQTVALTGWRSRMGEPTKRDIVGYAANDGRHLYLQFREKTDTTGLQAAESDLRSDCWDITIAAQRSTPYRQIAIGPAGRVVCREVSDEPGGPPREWDVDAWDSSDATAPGEWVAGVRLPIAALVPGGMERGGRLYMNITRRSGTSDDQPQWAPTFSDLNDPAGLREIILDAADSIPSDLPSDEELAGLRAQDLVAFWPLDDGAGDKARDISPSGLAGTLVNGAGWVRDGERAVLRLEDSKRQFVDMGSPPELDLAGPLTLEAWVRYGKSETWYPAIIGKGYEGTGCYSIHLRPGLTPWFEIDDEDGTRHHYNPTDRCINPGVWCHIACTYDGARMRVYINGREAGGGLDVVAGVRKNAEPFRIGWLGSYGHLNGCVRDVSVYRRAMSWGEVYARYKAGR